VCESNPYSYKSDIWALGCVLYELCTLKHAFDSNNLLGLVYKIVKDEYEPIPNHYTQNMNDLIRLLIFKGFKREQL
jgi:NIMA (never in mitosis gene a)-related kinase